MRAAAKMTEFDVKNSRNISSGERCLLSLQSEKESSSPVSHRTPVYPGSHTQVKPPLPCTHDALLRHGLSLHSSMSVTHTHTSTETHTHGIFTQLINISATLLPSLCKYVLLAVKGIRRDLKHLHRPNCGNRNRERVRDILKYFFVWKLLDEAQNYFD